MSEKSAEEILLSIARSMERYMKQIASDIRSMKKFLIEVTPDEAIAEIKRLEDELKE